VFYITTIPHTEAQLLGRLIQKRLEVIASLVAPGSVVVDVGTDHGYLPLYLIKSGICGRVIACDISANCIGRAAANIAKAGLSDAVTCIVSDGLSGVEGASYDTVVIAGMGGETIINILSNAELQGKTLILQPNTRQLTLVKWLKASGFAIETELYIRDRGRNYYLLKAALLNGQGRV
jgi:tRNA (adenine22-N1)-methyltransferase